MPDQKHPRRRASDKRWLRFDLTINLPLILTLVIGFATLAMTLIKGYYDHDGRLKMVELATANIKESKVVESQGVILKSLGDLDSAMKQQKEETNTRFNRLEDKLDRAIEGKHR